ncbi:MAG TPA: FtsX-like permease family protein, partial [bacterium]
PTMNMPNTLPKTKKTPGWLWKMAWRDSRTHRKRLMLFMTCIVLGIAALVAIGSFGRNLEQAIDQQAKTLLGADLLLASLQPFAPETEALIDSLGGEQAREIMFASMALFPKSGDTRLVQVRALQGSFPFYGKLVTEPADAATSYKLAPRALVDETLLLQFNAIPGDSVSIGAETFQIAGKIKSIPSEPPIASTFSPRVFIPLEHVDDTGLLQRGSLVTYRVYFKFGDNRDVQQLEQALEPYRNRYRLRVDTVAERKEDVGEVLGNLYRFLNLVGFVALVLGSIGVASAVHVYTRQKLGNVAILRCVGAKARDTFFIYLIQVAVMALVGSLLGAIVGVGIQIFLPQIFRDFLPVEIASVVSLAAILQGVGIGLLLALLFALLSLIAVRNVSPLLALRASYEENSAGKRDRMKWLVFTALIVVVTGFAILQAQNVILGLSFAAALALAFAILAGAAKMITVLTKRFFPKRWPYVWRQGLANLYRPNNQTLVLLLSIGLGTFLITTLYLSRSSLLQKVVFVAGGDRPNLILFDVQPDQQQEVADLVRSFQLPVLQEAPIVTMRIESLKGRTVEDILNDSTRTSSRGLLNWEYRTTFRADLFESEQIVAGNWVARVAADASIIPISFEEGAAQRLDVQVGDTMVWNVQGVPLTTTVTSLRKVDWQRIQANFMVVFPEGVLENAPQIFVLATRAETTEKSAELQRAVVRRFPNVSMIDLALVLNTFDSFLSKIAFVIRFMAFFSIVTGLIVLAAAVITSRYQRIQESVLLRTLGATRSQVIRIMVIEYVFLGGFAALTGLLLSYFGGWALAYFVFKAVFLPTLLPFMIVLVTVIALTVLIGMANSRGILDRPPLEVLRVEG